MKKRRVTGLGRNEGRAEKEAANDDGEEGRREQRGKATKHML
jgi:hypothetical protein